jgi:hypothetical protein
MKLIIIGTDHRLQQTVVQDEKTKAWIPRSDGHRYRKLIAYCIEKLGAKAVLEEAHVDQERTAPTIASTITKKHGLVWQSLGLDGAPDISDVLLDPPLSEALVSGVKPELLAGLYDLEKHKPREESMHATIMESLRKHDCVLAVVGFVHLGVLARKFEAEPIAVDAFLFTYPLVVDETRS